jgi:4-hydroxyproline epimerase
VGYLGMCGHGAIGLMVTLEYLGRIGPGAHRVETPVGTITAALDPEGAVRIENVPSYRFARQISVEVEGHGPITGDVAWGGNWFFLASDHGQALTLGNVEQLTEFAWRIRQALARGDITGEGGAEIDHVELFAPAQSPGADSRNFVLCPGKAYDRSPCGTGTSARLACLAADGKLQEGQVYRQEGILGGVFEGSFRRSAGRIIPLIRGSAWISADATLLVDPRDPFRMGIRR